jgi:hypothetical protein
MVLAKISTTNRTAQNQKCLSSAALILSDTGRKTDRLGMPKEVIAKLSSELL